MTEAIRKLTEAYNALMLNPHLLPHLPGLIEQLGTAALELQREHEELLQQSAADATLAGTMATELAALETDNARMSTRLEILEAEQRDQNETAARVFEDALKLRSAKPSRQTRPNSWSSTGSAKSGKTLECCAK
jgi:hypothetical protein